MLLTRYNDVMSKYDPFFTVADFFTKSLEQPFLDVSAPKNYRYEVKEDNLLLSLDLPGVKPEDVVISVSNKEISVSYNKKDEKKSFIFQVNEKYNPEAATAKHELGVLELLIPKIKPPEAKKIQIKVV